MLKDLYKLSFYKKITVLNEAHRVYLVQHIETGRTFVMKEMTTYNRSVFEQLVEHPMHGIPRIFEICENDGILTIIEEYISGINLAEYLDKHGTLSESTVISYVSQLCSILSELHSFTPAIIHRDIKPSNIMLTDDNRIVLIDLNSAKTANKGQSRDTELIGTHGFAAPEQYGFGASNIQTDIYSIGKLMLVLLTGNVDGINDYNGKLKPIINHCLNIDPRDRYESAESLQSALSGQSNKKRWMMYLCGGAVAILCICVTANILHKPSENNTVTYLPEAKIKVSVPDINKKAYDEESALSPEEAISPIGAYTGDDNEVLVIAESGLAYYYCFTESYTELECPWYMSDDTITITFSKMHCDVTASTADGYSSLIFRSESANWNTEEFIRFSDDYTAYIMDTPPSASERVTVLNSGEMQFVINDIQFTVPKNYIDYGDKYYKYEKDRNQYAFVDNNSGDGYISAAVFYYEQAGLFHDLDTTHKIICKDFADFFMTNTQVGHSESVSVAGCNGYSVTMSGLLNEGFEDLSGSVYSGPVYVIYDEKYNNYIYMFFPQIVGAGMDNSEYIKSITDSAVRLH